MSLSFPRTMTHSATAMNSRTDTPPKPPASMQGTPKLVVSGISKRFGPTFALQESTLDIAQGEFVTLLGPSGSGKTTLLMMIAGLLSPTSGDIWIDGQKATHQQPYQRDIGMMFQSYALFPHMTVFENIAFPLKMKGYSKERIQAAVVDVLNQVKLPHAINRFPSELSGGQQQRIALARSIVHRPSVVLMDEPLAALDKSLRSHMQFEIRQLQQELGMTVLYVTHDQEEAMTMSDRICLMNDARIEQVSPPRELYFEPRSIFAATFLGESNCLSGTLESHQDGIGVVRINGQDRLCGKIVGELAPGARCQLLFRPEAVQLAPAGHSSATSTNALSGHVLVNTMVGAFSRSRVALDDGTEVISVGLTSRHAAQQNGAVVVRFSPMDTLIFGGEK